MAPRKSPGQTRPPQPARVEKQPGQSINDALKLNLGTSGLAQYGGRIYEEFLPDLQSYRGRRVLREMRDNDPVIGGILFTIEMLVRGVSWDVKPADESQPAQDTAQFIRECLEDMETTWEDLVAEILSFLPFGFAFHEVVYKQRGGATDDLTTRSKFDDGLLGWRAWAARGQESLDRWQFDDDGVLIGFWQLGPPDFKHHYIPMEKALLFRTSTYKGNPEGYPITRRAYVPWYRKKHIEAIEAIGIERDLAGLPVAHVPVNITQGLTADDAATLATIKQIVTNIRRDDQEGIVWPLAYDEAGNKLYELELLSTGGSRQFDTDKIVARYDQRIAMSMLADFILLGHEAVGSKALGDSKIGLFTKALSAWLDSICATISDIEIPRLLALNGMIGLPPTLTHGDIDDTDLASLGGYLQALTTAGLLPKDPALIRHLFTVADLPKPDDAVLETFLDRANQAADLALVPPTPGGADPHGTTTPTPLAKGKPTGATVKPAKRGNGS